MERIKQISQNTAAVIDAIIVLVQNLKAGQLSFGDVTVHILSMALREEFSVTGLMSCLTHDNMQLTCLLYC